MGDYSYNWSLAFNALPVLFRGLIVTFEITIVASLTSIVAGFILAVCRAYGGLVVSGLAATYIAFFRSLSPYIYILWIYFGIAIAFGINLSAFVAGVISLTVLYAAYIAEIIRAALLAVDRGQHDAALMLGLSRLDAFLWVVVPQAARTALPPLVTSLVVLLKDSSLVAVIGAPDLMYITIGLVEAANHPFEFYTVAALLYFAIVAALSMAARVLETRLNRGFAS
jgi:His/Glu/Gln/Arg/opine family amino acid ABC transporter permease subunit